MSRHLFWLSDDAWAAIEPHLPKNQPGARRVDDRRVISGIVHVLKVGCRWCDCPADYGPSTTIYNRFNRWSRRGFWLKLLDALVDVGLNVIDTADVYSAWVEGHSGGESETIIGEWLKARPERRRSVVILTKVGMRMPEKGTGLSAAWIARAAEDSLRRLGIDVIDFYQAHKDDETTPLEETLGAFARLMEQGKVKAIGASNYSAERLAASAMLSAIMRRFSSRLTPSACSAWRAEALPTSVITGVPARRMGASTGSFEALRPERRVMPKAQSLALASAGGSAKNRSSVGLAPGQPPSM